VLHHFLCGFKGLAAAKTGFGGGEVAGLAGFLNCGNISTIGPKVRVADSPL